VLFRSPDLNLRSAELKKLMFDGRIRGIRDGEEIRFRKDEVAGLEVDDQEEDVAEELLFVEEEGVDEGMATAQISEEDTLLEPEPEALDEDIELAELEEDDDLELVSAEDEVEVSARAPVVIDEGVESTLDRSLVVITSVLMIYGILMLLALGRGEGNGLTNLVADFFK
jgi:hypothetical protein